MKKHMEKRIRIAARLAEIRTVFRHNSPTERVYAWDVWCPRPGCCGTRSVMTVVAAPYGPTSEYRNYLDAASGRNGDKTFYQFTKRLQ